MKVKAHAASTVYDNDAMKYIANAIAANADMIEVDVRRSGDGILVLGHNETFAGLEIGKSTYEEIKKRNGLFYRLSDVLAAFPKTNFDFDLKERDLYKYLPAVLQDRKNYSVSGVDIDRYVETKKTLVNAAIWPSFDSLLRGASPLDRAAVLDAVKRLKALGATSLNANKDELSDYLLALCGEAGIEVNVWTVNEEADLRRISRLPINSIATDKLALLQQILSENK